MGFGQIAQGHFCGGFGGVSDMETFNIDSTNALRIAAIGCELAGFSAFGIKRMVNAGEDKHLPDEVWDLLPDVDTVFFYESYDEIKPKTREMLAEARRRGFKTGVLHDTTLWHPSYPAELATLADYVIEVERVSNYTDLPSTLAMTFGTAVGYENLLRAGAEAVVTFPKVQIERVLKYIDPFHEFKQFIREGGRLILGSAESVPPHLIRPLVDASKPEHSRNREYEGTELQFLQGEASQMGFEGILAPEELEDFAEQMKVIWRQTYRRKVIVLERDQQRSHNLERAIEEAQTYMNGSDQVEIVSAHVNENGWTWAKAFEEATRRPNTFIALEDGSVLETSVLDIADQLSVIESIGGGLAFAHESYRLFSKLESRNWILADQPLRALTVHCEIVSGMDEMGLLTPLNKDIATRRAVEVALSPRRGRDDSKLKVFSERELAEGMGVNHSTLYRWMKSWGLKK